MYDINMERIDTIMNAMFTICPLCGAQPMQYCTTAGTIIRYTHAERNCA